ncbi:FAD-dependent oxidoreductase [Egicoccus halophilus]|uniref:Dehydrogenase n=1 Tax=Egicoccus halophilus TaxID=1670830 RepID=A0A8J3AID7_9ACTN|nr:GMC family oxidoreductase [Egicoccus halophilus]GGI09672.1 dehydrogenase [Egicoccus halophilus]
MSFEDLRDHGDGAVLRADVCIVGGGPAGITLALHLAEAGAEVALLEGGGERFDAEVQALYAGDVVGYADRPLDVSRLRYFGGSSNHWEGVSRPLDRSDFAVAPSGSLPGWPIDEDDLRGYYPRTHELLQLGDARYEPERWAEQTGRSLLALEHGHLRNDVLFRSPPTVFGRAYGQDLADAGVRVYLHANVVELLGDRNRVTGVRTAQFDGTTQQVHADTVVLATGGIENARLLLNSPDADGRVRGDRGGLVGCCFMEHPHADAGYLLCDPDLDLSFYTREQPIAQDATVRATFTFREESRTQRGMNNVTAILREVDETDQASVRSSLPGLAGIEQLRGRLQGPERTLRAYHVELMAEQLPNAQSRIQVTGARRDALGQPVSQQSWQLLPRDHDTLRSAMELLAAGLADVGVGRVHSLVHDRQELYVKGGNHHMGTTRMSEDPAAGVVDPDGRVHGSEGLYVAGSSVFPTGGYANPTFTIVALSLRLADHLRELR